MVVLYVAADDLAQVAVIVVLFDTDACCNIFVMI